MDNASKDYVTGKLLVSTNEIHDGLFHQSVIVICEHNEEGAFGLIVNKPTPHSLAEVFVDLNLPVEHLHEGANTYHGGPLGLDQGFLLYRATERAEGDIKVTDKLYMSASIEMLEQIANGVGPSRYAFALGYSSWGPGQLESEIQDNSWLVLPSDNQLIFNSAPEERYDAATAKLGIDINLLSTQDKNLQ